MQIPSNELFQKAFDFGQGKANLYGPTSLESSRKYDYEIFINGEKKRMVIEEYSVTLKSNNKPFYMRTEITISCDTTITKNVYEVEQEIDEDGTKVDHYSIFENDILIEEYWKLSLEMRSMVFKDDSGTYKCEEYDPGIDKFFYRYDGPARITYYNNGSKKCEEWYKDGKIHKDDGPAIIHYNIDGSYSSFKWMKNGLLYDPILNCSIKPPSITTYYNSGAIQSEKWYISDMSMSLHNNNYPALITYYDDGKVTRREEYWYENGIIHRNNGPAITEYYPNGNPKRHEWKYKGKHDRNDGPAIIEYDINGGIIKEEYYLIGVYLNNPTIIRYYKSHQDENIKEETWIWNGEKHRIYGPAEIISFFNRNKHRNIEYSSWYVYGVNISSHVKKWIRSKKHKIPKYYKNWRKIHKQLFRDEFIIQELINYIPKNIHADLIKNIRIFDNI